MTFYNEVNNSMNIQLDFLQFCKQLAKNWRKPKEKLSPAAIARAKLGINGQTGEELICLLVTAYKNGDYINVYQVLLNTEVDSTTFYSLQSKALSLSDRLPGDWSFQNREERIVRAIALMASSNTTN